MDEHKRNQDGVDKMEKLVRESYANLPRPECPDGETMFDYYDAILSKSETQQVKHHIEDCPFCRVNDLFMQFDAPQDQDKQSYQRFQKQMTKYEWEQIHHQIKGSHNRDD